MNINQQNALKGFCKMLLEKRGIQFEIGRTDCPETDGKVICLPDLKAVDFEEARGFVFHEALHVLHTSFETVRVWNTGLAAQPEGKIVPELANAIEDARIEHLGCEEFPGGQFILNSRLRYLNLSTSELAHGKPSSVFMLWLCGTGLMVQQEKEENFARFIEAARAISVATMGEDLVRELEVLLQKQIPQLQSTADSYQLAITIYELLKSFQSEAREKRRDEPVQPPSPKEANLAQFLETQEKNEFDNVLTGENGIKMKPRYQPGAKSKSTTDFKAWLSMPTFPMTIEPRDIELGRKVLKSAEKSASSIRCELQQLLAARVQKETIQLSRSGRKFAPKALSRLAVGNTRVMAKRVVSQATKDAYDTTMEVLLDRSGSMGVSQMRVALEIALILVLAVRRIKGCTSSLSLFSGQRFAMDVLPRNEDSAERKICECLCPGSAQFSAEEIGRIGLINAFGSTPLPEALVTSVSSLEIRPQHRKMLVVITDGDDQSSYDGLRERLEAGGIDLFVISIHSDNPKLEKLAMGYVWVPKLDACAVKSYGSTVATYGVDQSAELVKKLKQAVTTFVQTAMFRHH